jgi:mevalonate pyrophosphate decarboxylase
LAAINKLLGTAADSLAKAEAYNKEWQKLPQVNGQEAALTDEMQKSWNQMHEVMRLSIEYLRPTTTRPMAIWMRSRRRTIWKRSITAGAPKTTPC